MSDERLARIETAEAARTTIWMYAQAVDSRDWELLGSLFAAGAVMEMAGTSYIGRQAIVDGLRGMLPADLGTKHFLSNPRVLPTGHGEVRVTTDLHYEHVRTGRDARGWGVCIDDIRVVDGIGQITHKSFVGERHIVDPETALRAEIEQLETAEHARAASCRYAVAVDTQDLALLAAVFTEDAELVTRRGIQHGRDDIVAYYRPALADPLARKHFMVNQAVTWTAPGEAIMESYFIYTYAGDDTSILGWGNYVDKVRVVDGVGYIAHKRISIDMHADTRVGWAGELTSCPVNLKASASPAVRVSTRRPGTSVTPTAQGHRECASDPVHAERQVTAVHLISRLGQPE